MAYVLGTAGNGLSFFAQRIYQFPLPPWLHLITPLSLDPSPALTGGEGRHHPSLVLRAQLLHSDLWWLREATGHTPPTASRG